MLQYELKTLQALTNSLDPKNFTGENAPVELIEKNRSLIESECTRISEDLTKSIFTSTQDNIIERYIQYHQTGIIQIADQLQSYLHQIGSKDADQDTAPSLGSLVRYFISRLFSLLNFIERFFSKYFNLDAKIPEAYHIIAFNELLKPIDELRSRIDTHITASGLKLCLFDYLESFGKSKLPVAINFRSLIYLKEFINELEQLFSLNDSTDWNQKLSATLIYLNFNHLGFFSYYQVTIRDELDNADSKEQFLNILSRSLTNIKGLQTKPSFSFHPEWPSVKSMLEGWLTDEIAMAVISNKKEKTTPPDKEYAVTEKLVLNLSVAQIACLVKVLYEEGIYGSVSITDILKFTVTHFRSKRQQQISNGSLSKEYYSVSQVTAAVVKDILTKMIQRINKNYFPVVAAICAAYYSSLVI